jgi:hypothetical protein
VGECGFPNQITNLSATVNGKTGAQQRDQFYKDKLAAWNKHNISVHLWELIDNTLGNFTGSYDPHPYIKLTFPNSSYDVWS